MVDSQPRDLGAKRLDRSVSMPEAQGKRQVYAVGGELFARVTSSGDGHTHTTDGSLGQYTDFTIITDVNPGRSTPLQAARPLSLRWIWEDSGYAHARAQRSRLARFITATTHIPS